MGLYSKLVLPRLIDWAMDDKHLGPLRQELLSQAQGCVLEIGFGSGANLPYYPKAVEKLVAIDNSKELLARARTRIANYPGVFESILASADSIPLEKNSVDCVVSTFTLCSVPNTLGVLEEIKRILRPRGKLLFLEHGLAPDRNIQTWQKRLTPLHKRLGGGCHLDRNTLGLLADACCDVTQSKRFYVEGIPRPYGFVTMGEAEK